MDGDFARVGFELCGCSECFRAFARCGRRPPAFLRLFRLTMVLFGFFDKLPSEECRIVNGSSQIIRRFALCNGNGGLRPRFEINIGSRRDQKFLEIHMRLSGFPIAFLVDGKILIQGSTAFSSIGGGIAGADQKARNGSRFEFMKDGSLGAVEGRNAPTK